ncbi:MAG: amino acid permease [Bacteroidota bacterium]|nr:amino acid permease [Bacteroidota bacterium]
MKDLLRKKSISVALSEINNSNEQHSLRRTLNAWDLTAFGIAAVIGAGIFSTIGKGALNGGPGVSLLFVFTALACAFSALCYAEFASKVPIAGSAYTYGYIAFGEIIAWIIGWDLLLEYAIGNVVVAISWSDYFTDILNMTLSNFNMKFPTWLASDYYSALRSFSEFTANPKATNNAVFYSNVNAYTNAPIIAGIRIIFDFPALMITALITLLVYVGVQESKRTSNTLVIIKLLVILLVIVIGAIYIDTSNWTPFLPNGFSGMMKGVSSVFFAYIGFDAISTTAEECKNPKRDLPKGILYSLLICTVLYILISLVMTGMVNYTNFKGVGDPLSFIFTFHNVTWMRWVVGVSAVLAVANVLLVFQMGQPRIWMSISRDGLLPPAFSRIHPRFKTPSFSTILTGFVVGIPLFFFNADELTDFTSLGTLFAFVIVCGGILFMPRDTGDKEGKFRVPYVNGQFIIPIAFIVSVVSLQYFVPDAFTNLLKVPKEFSDKSWGIFARFPTWLFVLGTIYIVIKTYQLKYSIIPVLGLLSCFYLMTEVPFVAWIRFVLWLAVGLIIYFGYSRQHSKLNNRTKTV